MPVTGKTGADGVFIAFRHICKLLVRYNAKFRGLIVVVHGADLITDAQRDLLVAFVDGASATCALLEVLAQYSGTVG